MEKKRVSVQLEGRSYAIITTEDEAYVKDVAGQVTESIRRASQTGKNLDTRDCAVLAALDFCDDLKKAVRKNKDIVEKADQIIRQSGELQKRCADYKEKLSECARQLGEAQAEGSEYKERLANAINENTKCRQKIKTLEEQLAALVKENELLRGSPEGRKHAEDKRKFDDNVRTKKNERLMGYVPMRQYSLFEDSDEGKNGKKN